VLGLRRACVLPDLPPDRDARERIAGMVRRAATDGIARAVERAPERLVLTGGFAESIAILAEEVGLCRAGARDRPAVQPSTALVELSRAALARLADVLAQFHPVELTGLERGELGRRPGGSGHSRRSDVIAVAAVALGAAMDLAGFDEAWVSPSGRREGLATRELRRWLEPRVHAAEFTGPSPDPERTATRG
jgi:hypothetical protein